MGSQKHMNDTSTKQTRVRKPKSEIEPRAFDEQQAATYIGMSQSYLRECRTNGAREGWPEPPAYFMVGSSYRYDIDDLNKWIDAQPRFRTNAERLAGHP